MFIWFTNQKKKKKDSFVDLLEELRMREVRKEEEEREEIGR